jgi:D-alanine-D-alanine ligase
VAARKIAVVFGGPSPEHDISILTALQCERLLSGAGVEVFPLYWSRSGEWFLTPLDQEARAFLNGAPADATRLSVRVQPDAGFAVKKGALSGAKTLPFDAALNCCHGGAGENGGLHGLFDALGIPLTGGPAVTAALGMDKLAFGAVLKCAGLPTLERCAVTEAEPGFDGPYIVKPRYGGSSIGIEVVDDWGTAVALAGSNVHLRQGAVAEQFLSGAVDLNMAFRTAPEFAVSLLERPLRPEEGIYSYQDKYMQSEGLLAAPRELPAVVPDAVSQRAQELARQVHAVTGIRGVVRVDFLLHGDELFVNEVNTVPGAMSLYLWSKDVDPVELLLAAVEETRRGFSAAAPAPFEAGAALRAAGGISSKLGQIGSA